jgi:hypothetical protein
VLIVGAAALATSRSQVGSDAVNLHHSVNSV